MRARRIGRVATAVMAAGLLTACGSSGADDEAAQTPAADAVAAAEEIAEAEEAAAIPPKPDDETAAKYLAALEEIDPEILKREPERLIDRGREQCSTIKRFSGNPDKILQYANLRFTSPEHPNGFGDATANEINTVIVKHLCPDLA
ncbi:hypothetical protein FB565_006288 [Actinoplanes lutulentus]|uniref:DUF732 domain-containing protein n=1 Tax=Actinoplanes lutulentus TaxID=1287878 RepID=A0A327YZA9_9ACTN|nr:hypothetical protein [Actinoplanes lutulentus]MBB2946520.1 hypothetical protein [Actinoplanes lutulentus]RAK26438.1 hypothetical protein B0I29_12728 [Actinoplanes lutulentus]